MYIPGVYESTNYGSTLCEAVNFPKWQSACMHAGLLNIIYEKQANIT